MTSSRIGQILVSIMTPNGAGVSVSQRLLALATSELSVTGADLLLVSGTGPESIVASTDITAQRLAEAQLTVGEGPAIEACRARRPVLQPDIAATVSGHWPALAPTIVGLGVRAHFAFPLQVGAISLGVLEFLRDLPGPLSREAVDDALVFAEAATSILLSTREDGPAASPDSDWSGLYSDRAEVHQATGMVAVQEGVLMVEALLLLRAYAFSHGLPIHHVARDVVARRIRLDGRPGLSPR